MNELASSTAWPLPFRHDIAHAVLCAQRVLLIHISEKCSRSHCVYRDQNAAEYYVRLGYTSFSRCCCCRLVAVNVLVPTSCFNYGSIRKELRHIGCLQWLSIVNFGTAFAVERQELMITAR